MTLNGRFFLGFYPCQYKKESIKWIVCFLPMLVKLFVDKIAIILSLQILTIELILWQFVFFKPYKNSKESIAISMGSILLKF